MDLRDRWSYITYIARERLKNNVTERHIDDYGEELEIMGAAGELAARRFLRLPEKLHVNFDSGADLYVDEWPIDVKTTRLTKNIEHRFLQWPHWKRVRAPIIVMVAVDLQEQEAEVLGYTRREDILATPINEERKIPCHEVPVPELKPIHDLFSLGRYYGPAVRRRHPAFKTQATAYPQPGDA